MSHTLTVDYSNIKKKQLFGRRIQSVWWTDKEFFSACVNAYLRWDIAFIKTSTGRDIVDDTDIRYYQNDWFVLVQESIDVVLEKIKDPLK